MSRALMVYVFFLSHLGGAAELPGVDASLREAQTCAPSAVGFADAMHGWFTDMCGGSFETFDGGVSWARLKGSAPITLTRFAFLSGYGVALMMEKGKVLNTQDGGRTWTTVSLPADETFHALDAEEGHFWACGRSGAMVRSDDGGRSWRTLPTPLIEGCSAISFIDHRNGWASGASGRLFETTDGGMSWRRIPAPTRDDVEAIWWTASLGWLVTQTGLLRTLDGGQHWSPVDLKDLNIDSIDSVRDARGRIHFRFNRGANLEDSIPVPTWETATWGADGLISWRGRRRELRFLRGGEIMHSGPIVVREGAPRRVQLASVSKLNALQVYGWASGHIFHSEDGGKNFFVVGDTPAGARRIEFPGTDLTDGDFDARHELCFPELGPTVV